MEFLDTYIIPHWPFVAFALVCMIVVQVLKMAVWTEKRAKGSGKATTFFWWGRKTIALQSLVIGVLVGIIPGMPIGGGFSDTMGSRALYYAAAAILSTFLFSVLKGLAKQRGIDLTLPGVDHYRIDHDLLPVEFPQGGGDDEDTAPRVPKPRLPGDGGLKG
jgi:hypothetical protein